jgi:hypothetical protein
MPVTTATEKTKDGSQRHYKMKRKNSDVIFIRDVPPAVKQALKEVAQEENRTMSAQVLYFVKRALAETKRKPKEARL